MFTVSCEYHLPPNVCTCNLCLRASWLVDVKVYAVVCICSIGSHRFLLECELFGIGSRGLREEWVKVMMALSCIN